MARPGNRPLRKNPTAERRPRHQGAGSDYLERYPDDEYIPPSHRRTSSADSNYSRDPGSGRQEYFEERERYEHRAPGRNNHR